MLLKSLSLHAPGWQSFTLRTVFNIVRSCNFPVFKRYSIITKPQYVY